MSSSKTMTLPAAVMVLVTGVAIATLTFVVGGVDTVLAGDLCALAVALRVVVAVAPPGWAGDWAKACDASTVPPAIKVSLRRQGFTKAPVVGATTPGDQVVLALSIRLKAACLEAGWAAYAGVA
jgi:hypothetical protein